MVKRMNVKGSKITVEKVSIAALKKSNEKEIAKLKKNIVRKSKQARKQSSIGILKSSIVVLKAINRMLK